MSLWHVVLVSWAQIHESVTRLLVQFEQVAKLCDIVTCDHVTIHNSGLILESIRHPVANMVPKQTESLTGKDIVIYMVLRPHACHLHQAHHRRCPVLRLLPMPSDAPSADTLWYSLCPSVGTYAQLAGGLI